MVLAKLHPFWVGKHFDFLKTLGKSHVWAHALPRQRRRRGNARRASALAVLGFFVSSVI